MLAELLTPDELAERWELKGTTLSYPRIHSRNQYALTNGSSGQEALSFAMQNKSFLLKDDTGG